MKVNRRSKETEERQKERGRDLSQEGVKYNLCGAFEEEGVLWVKIMCPQTRLRMLVPVVDKRIDDILGTHIYLKKWGSYFKTLIIQDFWDWLFSPLTLERFYK